MNLEIDGRVLKHKVEDISTVYQDERTKAVQLINKNQIEEFDRTIIPQLEKFQSLTNQILKLTPVSEGISKLGKDILDDIGLSLKLTSNFENYLDSTISELEQRVIIILSLFFINNSTCK